MKKWTRYGRLRILRPIYRFCAFGQIDLERGDECKGSIGNWKLREQHGARGIETEHENRASSWFTAGTS